MNKVKLSRDALSAMVDAQSSEFETRQILQQLPKDPDLLETWKRYHAVRAILQSSPRDFSRESPKAESFSDCSNHSDLVSSTHDYSHLDISAAVSDKLKDEPPLMYHNADKSGSTRLPLNLPWIKSFAVAASVACVALLGVKFTADTEWGAPSQDILASLKGDVYPIQTKPLPGLRQQVELNTMPFMVENNAVLASHGNLSGTVSHGARQPFKSAHQEALLEPSNKKNMSSNSSNGKSRSQVLLSPLELYLIHQRRAAAVSALGLMPMTRALTADKNHLSTHPVKIRQTTTHQANKEGATFDGK